MKSFKYDVFLSHNGQDKPAVEELAHRLKDKGIEPWLDKWNLVPGAPWQEGIEEALNQCATYAVFIGPNGMGPWQHEEMREAISRRVEDGRPVIPVLLPGGRRESRGKLPRFLGRATWVEFRHTLDDTDAIDRLIWGITGVKPPPPGGETPVPVDACPYPGLNTFRSEDARFFFGREALTQWLLEKLGPSPGTQSENRFLAIIGDSGSGKSSLARAGLIPALKRGELEGSEQWPVVIFRPGDHPLEQLSLVLCAEPGIAKMNLEIEDTISRFTAQPRTLHRITAQALQDASENQRFVVLVDQFEEVFTLCKDEESRHAFIKNLRYAGSVPTGKTVVILTMRVDFYGKCAAYPTLAAAMSDNQVLVGPMTEDELRRVIEAPAQKVGCEFEPGLVDVLLKDIEHQAGSLPLLQHALRELWERRRGRRLTHDAYKALGKLEGALEQHANNVYATFSPMEKEVCKQIFLRLTQPGAGTADTKRRVSREELDDKETNDNVIQKLVNARLLTTEGEERPGGKSFIEISHEALINGWSKLRQWIDANRDMLRVRHLLTEAANLWEESKRSDDYLYQGARLAEAEEWRKAYPENLNELEKSFLERSIKLRDQLIRNRIRMWAGIAIVSVAFAIVAFGLFFRAESEKREADRMREIAIESAQDERLAKERATRELAWNYWITGANARDRDNDPLKASHYFMHAARLANDPVQAMNAYMAGRFLTSNLNLLDISEHQEHVRGVIFSRNGQRVVTWDEAGAVRLWNTDGKQWTSLTQHNDRIRGVAFSHDETRVLSWSDDGTAQVGFGQNGKNTVVLKHDGRVLGAKFSADDDWVLTWSDSEKIQSWNARTGALVAAPLEHVGKIKRADFSADKQRILTWTKDGIGQVWDVHERKPIHETGFQGYFLTAIFNRDKSRVAILSVDEKNSIVTVWDSQTLKPLSESLTFPETMTTAVFTPPPEKILIWGISGQVFCWNYTVGKQKPVPLLKNKYRHHAPINGALLSRGLEKILTWSQDGTARITKISIGDTTRQHKSESIIIMKHGGSVRGATFSNDNEQRRVLTWSDDATARVWHSQSGQPLTPPLRHDGRPVKQACFDADGQGVVTWSDGVVRVWDIQADGPVTLPMMHDKPVEQALFVEAKQQIMTISVDGTVRFWHRESGYQTKPHKPLGNIGQYNGLSVASNGHRILSWTGTDVYLWDIGVLQAPSHTFNVSGIQGAIFGKDNAQILIWDNTGKAYVYDADSQRQEGTLNPESRILDAVYNQDKTKALTWYENGEARVWDTYTWETIAYLRQVAEPLKGAIFSNDNQRILIWRSGGTAEIWDYHHNQPPMALFKNQNSIDGAVWSNDEKLLLTWGDAARVWDATSGEPISPYLLHKNTVKGGLFAKDGTWVLTWGGDNTARLWGARDGQPLTPFLKHNAPVRQAIISADGRQILTWADDGMVRLWSPAITPPSYMKLALLTHEVRTGSRLDIGMSELRMLGRDRWQKSKERLKDSISRMSKK